MLPIVVLPWSSPVWFWSGSANFGFEDRTVHWVSGWSWLKTSQSWFDRGQTTKNGNGNHCQHSRLLSSCLSSFSTLLLRPVWLSYALSIWPSSWGWVPQVLDQLLLNYSPFAYLHKGLSRVIEDGGNVRYVKQFAPSSDPHVNTDGFDI